MGAWLKLGEDSGELSLKKHVFIGIAAGLMLIITYAGVLVLLQGREHLLEQTTDIWYWVLLLATGFGVQTGLYSFIRKASRERRLKTTSSMATSGGVSTGSMVACCAHHLSDALPLIGAAGLTAFLVRYQTLFIVLGVASNTVGITYMLETIQRHELCPVLNKIRWNLGQFKKGAVVSSIAVLVLVALKTGT